MFYKKKIEQIEHDTVVLQDEIKLNIPSGSEKERSIKMIDFTEVDLQVIKRLQVKEQKMEKS